MSTAPRGSILFRYVPGVGRVAAVECGTGSGLTSTCATAFSTADQPLVAGTAANVAHDSVPFSYGITVVTGASGYFQVPTTGVYKIIPSLQILGGGNGKVTIWIKVNGANVPDSATLTLFKNGEESVITCEYLLELTANDQVQVWAITAAANGSVEYHPSGGSGADAYPAAPGVITNMYRIRQFSMNIVAGQTLASNVTQSVDYRRGDTFDVRMVVSGGNFNGADFAASVAFY